MPIKNIVIIGVVIVALGGIGAYLAFSNSGVLPIQNTQPQAGENQNTAGGEGAFSGSLADLATRGGDFKCTFGSEGTDFSSSGTAYVSGAKIRTDFSSKIQQINQTIDSHMIQDGGSVYVWTSLAKEGFKAKTTLGTEDATTQFSDQGVNINQAYNYNCVPWTVDSSLFDLPTGVTFVGQ